MSAGNQTFGALNEGPARRRRQLLSGIVYLLLTMFALALVVPQFLGQDKDQVFPLLQRVPHEAIALAILLQMLRYICFGLVARQAAAMLGRPLARRDVAQMMLASYSLSRVFSAGGATAFLVRVQYYLRQGLSLGRILALFITHNILSGTALLLVYVFSTSVLWLSGNLDEWRMLAAVAWLVLALCAAGGQVIIGLYPGLIERLARRIIAWVQPHLPHLGRWTLPSLAILSLLAGSAAGWWLTQTTGGTEQITAAAGFLAALGCAIVLLVLAWKPGLRQILQKRLTTRIEQLYRTRGPQASAIATFSGELSAGARQTFGNRRGMLLAFVFQAAGLAADIATLVLACYALQVPASPALIVSAFIIAYYAQLIAPTPGEAGAMEFALLGVLLLLGFAPLQATTTTLFYRFVSFWLPIPFGILAYFNLKREGNI